MVVAVAPVAVAATDSGSGNWDSAFANRDWVLRHAVATTRNPTARVGPEGSYGVCECAL